jgi:chitinase
MKTFSFFLLLSTLIAPANCFSAPKPPEKFEVTGYVFTRGTALVEGQIDPTKLTRINYAFANIKDGRMVLGEPADAQNFAMLTAMRNGHQGMTVLVSVGGWLWSTNFSDMARTPESRLAFEDSVMIFLRRYDLDGLDIDWEYPGLPGAGHPFRAEDKENFTALTRELRERFDAYVRKTGRRLYLTIAMGASDEVIAHTEMRKVQKYVDTVNLMTYDYYEASDDKTTGHHAPLFANPADPKKASADATVKAFEKAGVPAEKIPAGQGDRRREWAVRRHRKQDAGSRFHALLGCVGASAISLQRGKAHFCFVRGSGIVKREMQVRSRSQTGRRDVLGLLWRCERQAAGRG